MCARPTFGYRPSRHHSFRFHLPRTLSFGSRSSCYHAADLYPSYPCSPLFSHAHHGFLEQSFSATTTVLLLLSLYLLPSTYVSSHVPRTCILRVLLRSLSPCRPRPYYLRFKCPRPLPILGRTLPRVRFGRARSDPLAAILDSPTDQLVIFVRPTCGAQTGVAAPVDDAVVRPAVFHASGCVAGPAPSTAESRWCVVPRFIASILFTTSHSLLMLLPRSPPWLLHALFLVRVCLHGHSALETECYIPR